MTTGQRDPNLGGSIPDDSLLNMRVAEATEMAQQPAPGMGLSILDDNPVSNENDAPDSSQETGLKETARPLTELETLTRIMDLLTRLVEAPGVTQGFPIARAGRVSTTSSSYQQLAIWTISADRIGKLLEVSMASDTPATAKFRLMMNGEVQFTDLILDGGDGSLTLPFEDNMLRSELVIELLVVSNGSTAIVANGTISGIERDQQ